MTMTYLIPKALKKGIQIVDHPFKVTLKDFVFAGAWLLMAFMLSSCIHSSLLIRIPYWVLAALSAFYLTRPAGENPGKRKWEAILTFIASKINRPIYYSVEAPKTRKVVRYEKEISQNGTPG